MSSGALAVRFDLLPDLDTATPAPGTDRVRVLYSENFDRLFYDNAVTATDSATSLGSEVERVRLLSDALLAENDRLRGDTSLVAMTLLRLNREMLTALAQVETTARMKDALLQLDADVSTPEPARPRLVLMRGGARAPARSAHAAPGYRPLYGRRHHP